MVPADSGRVSPAPPYSGFPPWAQSCVYGAVTRSGHVFQTCSTCIAPNCAGPTTPGGMPPGLGCSASARHYSRNHCCFLFLRVLRCFSSPGRSPCGYPDFIGMGCPIRTPADISVVCTSPQLFAAYRVLRHRWEPRHPPCALISLPFLRAAPHPCGAPPGALAAPASLFRLSLSFPVLSMNFFPGRPAAPETPRPCCARRYRSGADGPDGASAGVEPAPPGAHHRAPPLWLCSRSRRAFAPQASLSWRIRDSNP
jgi:hypothetical protein